MTPVHLNILYLQVFFGLALYLWTLSSIFATETIKPSAIKALSSTAKSAIRPYEAVYKAIYKEAIIPITLTGTRRFAPTKNGLWELYFIAETFFVDLKEQSLLQKNGVKLIPNAYYYRTTGLVPEYYEHRFDWNIGKIYDIKYKVFWPQKPQNSINGNTHDNMSYQEQLRQDVKLGKKKLEYVVAIRGKIKLYEFEILQKETLETDIGTLNCIKVAQKINQYNKLNTYSWLATDLDYVLVKVKQKRDGELTQEAFIQQLTFLDTVSTPPSTSNNLPRASGKQNKQLR